MTTDLAEAVALLMEARDFGQFSDDMLDHPSPDVRSPVKSVREALRLVIDSPEFQALAQGRRPDAIATGPGDYTYRMTCPAKVGTRLFFDTPPGLQCTGEITREGGMVSVKFNSLHTYGVGLPVGTKLWVVASK